MQREKEHLMRHEKAHPANKESERLHAMQNPDNHEGADQNPHGAEIL